MDAAMERVAAAYQAGRDTAQALRVGDIFTGASPAAKAQGYGDDRLELAAFIEGYLENLQRPISTDWAGRITKQGKQP